jgi:hypothetical protein
MTRPTDWFLDLRIVRQWRSRRALRRFFRAHGHVIAALRQEIER